jgi:hypothetical protein
MSAWVRGPLWLIGILLVLLSGPLAVVASGRVDLGTQWRSGNRDSTGQAPHPSVEPGAVVQVYGARTVHWRGAFGIHSWIAVKRSGASDYTIYQVLGWRAYRGGRSVDVRRGGVPDGRWFGEFPDLLGERRGPGVDALIDRVEAAVENYPWADRYRVWPGPNSNTFIAHIARQVPELRVDLPPTAIGKDFLGHNAFFASTPSGTGWQFSAYGLLGASLGWEEGLELNLLGLSFGIDLNDLALRLPGIGSVGVGGRAAPPVHPQAHSGDGRPLAFAAGGFHRRFDEPDTAGAVLHPGVVSHDGVRSSAVEPRLDLRCDAEVDVGERLQEGLRMSRRQTAGVAG